MSRITKEWIADNAVDASKIKFANNEALKARNFADSADIELIKLNASDKIEFPSLPVVGGVDVALTSDIPVLPATFELQGNWNASTNTPTLVDSTNSTGDTNPLYIVNVAGTTSIDGNALWSAGDHIYFANGVWNKADNVDDVLSVAGKTGVVTLDTDDVSEGTNLYHTTTRARTAAVVDSTAGSETDQAASVASMKTYVAGQVSGVSQTFGFESFTLIAGDITNGYVDLAQTPLANSVHVFPKGGPGQEQGVDFTISTNRVTFAGDLATYLVAGNKLVINYAY